MNDRGNTVSIAYEEDRRMKAGIELLEILSESDDDVEYGRVAAIEDTFRELRKLLKE